MQSDIELVITRFSEIEKRFVDDLKATEKNGHIRTSFIERLTQVEHLFSRDSIIRIKSIASLRNKLAHGQLQSIPDKNRFLNDCQLINIAIDAAKRNLLLSQQPRSANSIDYEPSQSSNLGLFVAIVIGFFSVLMLILSTGINSNKASLVSHKRDNIVSEDNFSPIRVKLLKKGIKKDRDIMYCEVKISNTTKKAITGMRGYCQIYDENNKELHKFFVHFDDKQPIKEKSSKILDLGVLDEYDQFKEEDRLFKNTDISKMKCRLKDLEIVYGDGTSEEID